VSKDEIVTVSSTGGQKAGNLERYDLIPPRALENLAHVATYMPQDKPGTFSELLWHVNRWWAGEDVDTASQPPLSGFRHLPLACWHALRIAEDNIITPRFPDAAAVDWQYSHIPVDPLRRVAEHFGRGAKKYADRNWERGYEWGKSYAALHRHTWSCLNGYPRDEETGSLHITATAWHCLVLDTFVETHPEFDDRPDYKRPSAFSVNDQPSSGTYLSLTNAL
jgi:hypothetical protein